jgi:hypothetical protein
VFLSADRYVVQLLDVGWDAEPPYYVMEYVENGSLAELLRDRGTLSVSEAVELFRETAVGLAHAHGKGVLHCDLKPANILLDQDQKPRLADFGQSRLSHEQTPALGTLFYMAPEQADLEAVPDARWDVYALGALLYCMLTGRPPYRSEDAVDKMDTASDLTDRLGRYRELIRSSPPPSGHLRAPGMDRALAEIIDRCLAKDPDDRFANVQEVLNALRARALARARQPLMMLGIVGPILLLLVMGLFGWRGYNSAMNDSDLAVTDKVKESNAFAAKYVAGMVAWEIDHYFRAVEEAAGDPEFRRLLAETVDNEELSRLLTRLRDPTQTQDALSGARGEFETHSDRQALQNSITKLLRENRQRRAASWFVCDAHGTQLAADFATESPKPTIGKNYAYRTYCHGGPRDLDERDRPLPDQRIAQTHLSALLLSTATGTWKVAVSTPVFRDGEARGEFLGVLALTLEVGDFMEFAGSDLQFAVLVDGRAGDHAGVILQHPLFDRIIARDGSLPQRFSDYRVQLGQQLGEEVQRYRDPLGQDDEGKEYDRDWIAAKAPVVVDGQRVGEDGERASFDTGLIVLVQEDCDAAIGLVHQLGRRLVHEGLLALGGVVCVVFVLWFFVLRAMGEPRGVRGGNRGEEGLLRAILLGAVARRRTAPARKP